MRNITVNIITSPFAPNIEVKDGLVFRSMFHISFFWNYRLDYDQLGKSRLDSKQNDLYSFDPVETFFLSLNQIRNMYLLRLPSSSRQQNFRFAVIHTE